MPKAGVLVGLGKQPMKRTFISIHVSFENAMENC